MNTGSSVCFDFAFVFNQESNNAVENVNMLLSTADNVQYFYENNIQPCNQIFLDTPTEKKLDDVSIYPNPSNGNFTIQLSQPALISIYSITGNVVINELQ